MSGFLPPPGGGVYLTALTVLTRLTALTADRIDHVTPGARHRDFRSHGSFTATDTRKPDRMPSGTQIEKVRRILDEYLARTCER